MKLGLHNSVATMAINGRLELTLTMVVCNAHKGRPSGIGSIASSRENCLNEVADADSPILK